MIQRILTTITNKKGATLFELLLITGGIMLITALGMQMFKGSFNSVSQTVTEEIMNAQNNY